MGGQGPGHGGQGSGELSTLTKLRVYIFYLFTFQITLCDFKHLFFWGGGKIKQSCPSLKEGLVGPLPLWYRPRGRLHFPGISGEGLTDSLDP